MNRKKLFHAGRIKQISYPLLIPLCAALGLVFPAQSHSQESTKVSKLDEIVITATRTPHTLSDVPVETVVITAEEIEKTNAQKGHGCPQRGAGCHYSQP